MLLTGAGALGCGRYSQSTSAHAEEVFRQVQMDFGVLMSAFQSYREELLGELGSAAVAARRGDWAHVLDVVRAYR